jgi:pimeloyl-ACP methyl ester carboxylesterase
VSITERTINTDRAEIHVRESAGAGAPLLLLHGSGASSAAFRRQLDSPLGDTWRLVAIDLPGHGRSSNAENPQRDYTIGGLARTIAEVLDPLELDRCAVLGWSLGGHIAIELMAARSDLAGLMLCGTPPIGRGSLAALRAFRTSLDLLLGWKAAFTPRDAERFLRLCYGDAVDPAFVEDVRRADGRLRPIVLGSVMRGEGVDQKQTVEHASIPIAMVNGADEPMARLSYIDKLEYRTLWEGEGHVIPGAGHAPFWHAPEQFNMLLHRFMVSVELGRGRDSQPSAALNTRRAG